MTQTWWCKSVRTCKRWDRLALINPKSSNKVLAFTRFSLGKKLQLNKPPIYSTQRTHHYMYLQPKSGKHATRFVTRKSTTDTSYSQLLTKCLQCEVEQWWAGSLCVLLQITSGQVHTHPQLPLLPGQWKHHHSMYIDLNLLQWDINTLYPIINAYLGQWNLSCLLTYSVFFSGCSR